MKRTLCVMLSALAILTVQAHAEDLYDTPTARTPALALLPDVESFTLRVTADAPCYRIWLYKPSSAHSSAAQTSTDGEAPNETGGRDAPPLLVLLDGNATFALAVSAARLQARLIGPVVIAAIAAPNEAIFDERQRFRDFTTAASDTWGVPRGADGRMLQFGGARAFDDLLDGPLLRAIEARVPVSRTRRTLFGHSLGGFFVLHHALSRPASRFSRIVAASPSLWWNDRELLRTPSLGTREGSLTIVLRAGGEEQTVSPDATPARIERVRRAAMLDNLHALAATLEQNSAYDVSVGLYPGANHVSYLPAALAESVVLAAKARAADQ
ncbi:alpha/beta hydrolase-fold protein [Caballeronia sp. LZ028]|uniref:alpha/beta hydrolase n=1 Tax=Caballeronia sp. LZ028 TaxID=3038563 RepID=UPI00285C46AC|nr:alpha/beta hydrolase-fold protein [Caballeronia sp. LZ028]MDR5770022.1 alpha/beta hydrolase-fold protein [Caballeronia sp. LZ028]